jgi:predicted nucleotidyltransferase
VDPKDKIPAEWPELDVRRILRRLVAAGVDFVVIGGVAVLLHGYPRFTRDLDIAFAYDSANLDLLGRCLIDLNSRLRGVDEQVPFVPDGGTLHGVELLTLTTEAGWLDVHRLPQGVANYERLRRNAERVDLDGFSALVASPDDLIAMKRAAGRPQDQTDIAALEAIKRLRSSRPRRA